MRSRIFFITVLFFVWCFGCTYWYICKIKFLCEENLSEMAVSQIDINNINLDTLSALQTISLNDTVKVLQDTTKTQNIYFNKSFNIVFKYKSTEFISNLELENSLKELALFSSKNPTARVEIIGHTDNAGSAPTNIVLGQQRAESVMQTLYQFGATQGKISAMSKGETEPIVENSSEEGRKINRRVQIIIKK